MRKIFGVRGWWLPMMAVAFIFSAHLSYGANTNALAMVFALMSFLLGLIALVLLPKASWVLAEPSLRIIALLFSLTLIYTGLQLTPYLPGGGHPFWAWTGAREAITLDRDATIREWIKLGGLAALFVTGLMIGADDRRAILFFKVMLFAGVAFALWAFFIYISDAGAAPEGVVQRNPRLHASFQSANSAAVVMGGIAILALAALIRSIKEIAHRSPGMAPLIEQFISRTPTALIALLLSLIALLLTASRGGISASLMAMLVFIGWELSRGRSRTGSAKNTVGVLLLAIALLLFAFVSSGDLFFQRMSLASWGDASRNITFSTHWQAILAAPWSGYGMGSFYLVNDMMMNPGNWPAIHKLGAMHNVYLQWLEEGGVIGAALMWSTLVCIIWTTLTGLRRRHRKRTWIRAVLCVSLLFLVHGLVEYGLQVPSIAMGWAILLGVGYGLSLVRPS
jgi:O-antigen ligase